VSGLVQSPRPIQRGRAISGIIEALIDLGKINPVLPIERIGSQSSDQDGRQPGDVSLCYLCL